MSTEKSHELSQCTHNSMLLEFKVFYVLWNTTGTSFLLLRVWVLLAWNCKTLRLIMLDTSWWAAARLTPPQQMLYPHQNIKECLMSFRIMFIGLLDISPRISRLALQDVYSSGVQKIWKSTVWILQIIRPLWKLPKTDLHLTCHFPEAYWCIFFTCHLL